MQHRGALASGLPQLRALHGPSDGRSDRRVEPAGQFGQRCLIPTTLRLEADGRRLRPRVTTYDGNGRPAVLLTTTDSLADLGEAAPPPVWRTSYYPPGDIRLSKIAFLFPGQGAQEVGMGQQVSRDSQWITQAAQETAGFM